MRLPRIGSHIGLSYAYSTSSPHSRDRSIMPRQRIMNKALRPTVGLMKAEVAIDNNSRPRCQDSPDFHRCINSKAGRLCPDRQMVRSEEHTSELQSLMRISYAVFCLKKKHK